MLVTRKCCVFFLIFFLSVLQDQTSVESQAVLFCNNLMQTGNYFGPAIKCDIYFYFMRKPNAA